MPYNVNFLDASYFLLIIRQSSYFGILNAELGWSQHTDVCTKDGHTTFNEYREKLD